MDMITKQIMSIKKESGAHSIVNKNTVRFLLFRISNNSVASLSFKIHTKNTALFYNFTVIDFVTNSTVGCISIPTVLDMFSKEIEENITLFVLFLSYFCLIFVLFLLILSYGI
jgi:hypothetical protein